eukprot:1421487-Alexandrium_andersonii.AAC.1
MINAGCFWASRARSEVGGTTAGCAFHFLSLPSTTILRPRRSATPWRRRPSAQRAGLAATTE